MSGKSTARTNAKHRRRRLNDAILVRNFLAQMKGMEYDAAWTSRVLKILGVKTGFMRWPMSQRVRDVNMPQWFEAKIERLKKAHGLVNVSGELYGPSTTNALNKDFTGFVSSVKVRLTPDAIQLANTLGIRITRYSHDVCCIEISGRDTSMVPLHKKQRPPKPEGVQLMKKPATENVSDDEFFIINKTSEIKSYESRRKEMLAEVEALRAKIAELDKSLDMTKAQLKAYMMSEYGIF